MQFESITQEEVKGLQFSSRTGKESPWKAILDATNKGPVKVTLALFGIDFEVLDPGDCIELLYEAFDAANHSTPITLAKHGAIGRV